MKVLVVDDKEIMRELIKTYLSKYKKNCEVSMAKDGKEALDIIKETSPSFDLIITDTKMPEMEGTELTKWVKTNFPEIPIILMSGMDEPAEHQADAFLSKPIHLKELGETINSLLMV